MKRSLSLIVMLVLFSATAALAVGPPGTINYQGRLLDVEGNPVNGSVNLFFRIWSSSSGGTMLWSGPPNSPTFVTDGLFSCEIGGIVTGELSPTIFNINDAWLEVEVNGELMPREQLLSVPYALTASRAEGAGLADNSNLLQGLPASEFAAAAHVHNAGDLVTGTVSTDRYNAYQDLVDAGDLANDASSNLLTRDQLDGRFSSSGHTHTDPAPTKVQAYFSVVIHKTGITTAIAHAVIGPDGTKLGGTANVSSVWEAGSERYSITIAGENFFYSDYSVAVTRISGATPIGPIVHDYASSNNALIVQFWQF